MSIVTQIIFLLYNKTWKQFVGVIVTASIFQSSVSVSPHSEEPFKVEKYKWNPFKPFACLAELIKAKQDS